MKKYFKHIILPALITAMAPVMTSCLEEAYPEDGQITGGELAGGDKSALAAAMPSYFNAGGDENWDIGFGGSRFLWMP